MLRLSLKILPLLLAPLIAVAALDSARTPYQPTLLFEPWPGGVVRLCAEDWPASAEIGVDEILQAGRVWETRYTSLVESCEPPALRLTASPTDGGSARPYTVGMQDRPMTLSTRRTSRWQQTAVHEIGHAFGFAHPHQSTQFRRCVAAIDYNAVSRGRPPQYAEHALRNWLPIRPAGLLPVGATCDELLTSIMTYHGGAIEYHGDPPARPLTASVADVAAIEDLYRRWSEDPDSLLASTPRPLNGGDQFAWIDAGVLTLRVAGGADVLGHVAPGRLASDTDWGWVSLRAQRDGWRYESGHWIFETDATGALAVIGDGLFVSWTGTADAAGTVTVYLRAVGDELLAVRAAIEPRWL